MVFVILKSVICCCKISIWNWILNYFKSWIWQKICSHWLFWSHCVLEIQYRVAMCPTRTRSSQPAPDASGNRTVSGVHIYPVASTQSYQNYKYFFEHFKMRLELSWNRINHICGKKMHNKSVTQESPGKFSNVTDLALIFHFLLWAIFWYLKRTTLLLIKYVLLYNLKHCYNINQMFSTVF